MSNCPVTLVNGGPTVVIETRPTTVLVQQIPGVGPPGPPGPPGPGGGDMYSLVYDPGGVAANVFDAANLSGVIDAGTFT